MSVSSNRRAVALGCLVAGLLCLLPLSGHTRASDAPKPSDAAPATQPAAGAIDWERAKSLYQRSQRGEKLSAEDQAYLDLAKAARQGPGARAEAAGVPAADIERAMRLRRKLQTGEKLTEEEQAFLDRVRGQVQKAGGPNAAGAPPPPAARESTGLVPLTQLAGDEKYKGQDGGLYGGGRNEPPADHLKAALKQAAAITPLDPAGKPSPDGKVVLMSIGMSNTTQEFSRFKQLADADPEKSPRLTIVDAAQGGKDAAAWTSGADAGDADKPGSPPGNAVWEEADRRLKAAGVTPEQVQVVWVKQALIQQGRHGEFPEHARVLQKHLESILTIAKRRYPNLRLAYLSSRIYAGYAASALNPEPYAYEGAFSVRWVIDEQAKGEAKLNYDPARGEVKAPLALWGPYLWADGVKGRKGDDLVYRRDDLGLDGTHPSASGRTKVAELLLKFFKSDPTAKTWFVKGT